MGGALCTKRSAFIQGLRAGTDGEWVESCVIQACSHCYLRAGTDVEWVEPHKCAKMAGSHAGSEKASEKSSFRTKLLLIVK